MQYSIPQILAYLVSSNPQLHILNAETLSGSFELSPRVPPHGNPLK